MESYSFLQVLGIGLFAASAFYLTSYAVAVGVSPLVITKSINPNKVWKMTLLGIAMGVILFLYGCAGLSDPAKPRTAAEEFPYRNQDPRVGVIVNSGTAPMNLYVYDQANRLVEQVYMSGAERHVVSNSGQPYPQYWARRLEQGCYRVEAFPFHYAIRWTALAMVSMDLPKQMYSVCVGNNPTAYHYGGTHWGWLLHIGANIPDGATGLPLFQVLNPFSR